MRLNTIYDVAPCCYCCNTDHVSIQDPAVGIGQEERFFNKLEDDVSRIIQREKRHEQYAVSQGQEVNTSTEHEPVSGQRQTRVQENTSCVY